MSDSTKITAETKKIVIVPLGKLKKLPKNVRKVAHTKVDIKAPAASIAALGMLQNPVVEPELGTRGKPTGYYLVNATEGRRLARLLRVKRRISGRTIPPVALSIPIKMARRSVLPRTRSAATCVATEISRTLKFTSQGFEEE